MFHGLISPHIRRSPQADYGREDHPWGFLKVWGKLFINPGYGTVNRHAESFNPLNWRGLFFTQVTIEINDETLNGFQSPELVGIVFYAKIEYLDKIEYRTGFNPLNWWGLFFTQ